MPGFSGSLKKMKAVLIAIDPGSGKMQRRFDPGTSKEQTVSVRLIGWKSSPANRE
jgi:hypothetical protein